MYPRILKPVTSLSGHSFFLLSLNVSSASSSQVTLPILISIMHGRTNLLVMFSSFKYLDESEGNIIVKGQLAVPVI